MHTNTKNTTISQSTQNKQLVWVLPQNQAIIFDHNNPRHQNTTPISIPHQTWKMNKKRMVRSQQHQKRSTFMRNDKRTKMFIDTFLGKKPSISDVRAVYRNSKTIHQYRKMFSFIKEKNVRGRVIRNLVSLSASQFYEFVRYLAKLDKKALLLTLKSLQNSDKSNISDRVEHILYPINHSLFNAILERYEAKKDGIPLFKIYPRKRTIIENNAVLFIKFQAQGMTLKGFKNLTKKSDLKTESFIALIRNAKLYGLTDQQIKKINDAMIDNIGDIVKTFTWNQTPSYQYRTTNRTRPRIMLDNLDESEDLVPPSNKRRRLNDDYNYDGDDDESNPELLSTNPSRLFATHASQPNPTEPRQTNSTKPDQSTYSDYQEILSLDNV